VVPGAERDLAGAPNGSPFAAPWTLRPGAVGATFEPSRPSTQEAPNVTAPTAQLPLTGIRVVELGHSVAAPYAGLVLAELGAEVVKVEKPDKGDDARGWGPPFHEGTATTFLALNRNKSSLTVDLRSKEQLARLADLIAEADVVVQNMKPGHAAKLGLGPDDLLKRNPRLIYTSIWAFGAKGPMAGLPGYDPLMQAFGGIMSVTGENGAPPVRVGTSIVDMGAGMWIVIGVLAALFRRAATGQGGRVDTSLFETALGWMFYHVPGFAATGEVPTRHGSGVAMIAPYQVFRACDGDIVIGAGNDRLFAKLARLLGHAEWADDPRYQTNGGRVVNRADICGRIQAIVATKPVAHWEAALRAADIPCAPVQGSDQVLAHPQTRAIEIVRKGAGSIEYFGLPLAFDGLRPGRNEPPPGLGQSKGMLEKGWGRRAE
jgi:crotonobetainyl-CoA:carnitine CoA-transferase CaiB-like acyl-CoA transferase